MEAQARLLLRRSRADLWPLAVTVLVVALTVGVTDAVPETTEAALQLAENTLVDLGVPMGFVIASIHEQRDEYRKLFQDSAKRPTRALRGRRGPGWDAEIETADGDGI